jgi:uncharacterized protein (UPF0548 family)
VFFSRKPGIKEIEELTALSRAQTHSYSEVGATRATPPVGYNIDHNRVVLGRGTETFRRAMTAIDEWRMFDMPWIELVPARPEAKEGETVAVVVKHFGFYSVNISRVVYRIEDEDRYGFAYGTLPCHSERGEERFMVEHDQTTDEVWYDVYAFSKPHALAAQIGYALSRRLQKRFAKESMEAMQRAVSR